MRPPTPPAISTDALSPLDVLVLRAPNATPAAQAVRVALGLLAARGVLAPAPAASGRRGPWSAGQPRLRLGRLPDDLPPALAVVARALRGTPAGDDVALATTEIVARLQRAFGYGYGRYVSDHLRPPLVERGLLEVETYTRLRFLTRRRFRLTDAGARLRTRADRDVARLAELPALLAGDPRRAARVAASLGALVLLDDALRRHHAALAVAMREHGGADVDLADGAAAAVAELIDGEPRRARLVDALDALGHVDWGAALDAVEAVSDALGDAFDGGGDGDGGDGGGDGGGGGSD